MLSRIAYSLFFYALVPFVLLRLLLRSRRAPAYRRRWAERFGYIPSPAVVAKGREGAAGAPGQPGVIWVHSVSVGETLAAVPLIKNLQRRYPRSLLAVTTMTPTGSDRVLAAFGDSVYHVYAPYDLPCVVRRFLARLQPELLVIMETELWPNLVHLARDRGIPVVLANARLSAKSAEGYRRISWLSRPMLERLNTVAAQTEDDGRRFVDLGLPASALRVTGNIKFDLELSTRLQAKAEQLAADWRGLEAGQATGRPVFLVASTHRGEDEILLQAFARIRASLADVLLVLVPRHPERFDEVDGLCRKQGYRVIRRSSDRSPAASDDILLGDTMGELPFFFGACDVAFVGGSLVPVGGHNLIEPAAWGVPVLSGPHLFNFAEASGLLLAAGAMQVCDDAGALAEAALHLLQDPSARQVMGAAARRVAEANRGAMERLLEAIGSQITAVGKDSGMPG